MHARVEWIEPSSWEDRSLVQLWGPRFSAYVVPAADRAVFTLGRLPEDGPRKALGEDIADRLDALFAGQKVLERDAGRLLGLRKTNMLRFAAPTGRLLIRWDGARQPTIWTVPAPEMDPREALLELARRYLHVFGPAMPESFAEWAGIKPPRGQAAFEALGDSFIAVRTPIGDGWILAEDEPAFHASPRPPAAARLLPSGDTFYLLWGPNRELLVPQPERRSALWTSRVWPGAILVEGEIVGTWRRAQANFTIETWRRLSQAEREAVEAEAAALPLPGAKGQASVRWVAGRQI